MFVSDLAPVDNIRWYFETERIKRYMSCRVAVIDSGVNDYFIKKVSRIYSFNENDYLDENGHGSKCISLIYSMAPKTEIFVFKLLDQNLKCTSEDLYKVLLKLLDIKVDIINLSLSTANIEQFHRINDVCQKLFQQGKIIIASKANSGEISYPAESKYVIGVDGNQFISNEEFWFNNDISIQCIASRTPCVVEVGNQEYTFFSGNSKAAVCLTGIIAKNFNDMRYLDILKKLKYILSLSNRTHWKENEITVVLKKRNLILPTMDLKIIKYIKKLLKKYIIDKDKCLYECIGIDGMIRIVKSIGEKYSLDLSKCEINLYDFVDFDSLYLKIDYINREVK